MSEVRATRRPPLDLLRRASPARWLALAVLTVAVAGSGAAAWFRNTDSYDVYDFRRSAVAFVGGHDGEIVDCRAPLVPFLFSPFMLAREAGFEQVAWKGPHVVSFLAFALTLLGAACLVKKLGGSREVAWLAAAFLACDRLFLQLAPAGSSDVLASCAATWFLWGLLTLIEKRNPSPRVWVIAGMAGGGATLLRFNMALLVPFALLMDGLVHGLRRRWVGRFTLGLASLLVYFGLSWAFFSRKYGLSLELLAAPLHFFLYYADYPQYAWSHRAGSLFYLESTLTSLGWLVPGLALLALGSRRRRSWTVAMLLAWYVFHNMAIAVVYPHEEARYAMPTFPALCVLAALGLSRLAGQGGKLRWGVLSVLALIPGVYGGWDTLNEFRKPFYSQKPFPQTFWEKIAELSELGGRPKILWIARGLYATYPRDHKTPFPDDPFNGIHHVAPMCLNYHRDADRFETVRLLRLEHGGAIEDFVCDYADNPLDPVGRGDILLFPDDDLVLNWTLAEPPAPLLALVIDERGTARGSLRYATRPAS